MAKGAKRSGLMGGLLAGVERLRAAGGKRLADVVVTLLVAAVAAGAALYLKTTVPMRLIERQTEDFRIAYGAPPARNDLVIVKMDDAAINAMRDASACHCLAPIDKAWLGDLVAAIDAKHPKAIVVDYLLDVWASPEEFQDFQARIAGVTSPIVAAVDPHLKAGVDFPVAPKLLYADARALAHNDVDDIIRNYDPKPSQYWSLSARTAMALGETNPPTRPFAIRYRAPDPRQTAENRGAITPSFSAAYAAFLPAEMFKDKVVFIGSVTRSAHADSDTLKEDMHMTPLRFLPGHVQGTPGVEVHVHALEQMLEHDRIAAPGALWTALIVLAASLIGAMLGRSTQSLWISLGIVLLLIAAFGVGGYIAYQQLALMLPMMAPVIGFAVAFFVLSRLSAAELQTQRAFYSSTLERYLAPQVIDRMVEGGEAVKIGAEEREITVMISDLENFSSLVANLDLETFEGVINEYFDGVIDILWKHEAMIDKMTGDGIIAIFGAPVPTSDHADRALACARELDRYAMDIRRRMIGRGITFGHTRMGISSGTGLVGNFGGERRFNYTAYGEVVVIAARLEAANKTFGTRILFSGDTLRLARRELPVEPVGEIDLKGVPVPIPAYTTPLEA
jgi:class 3 adenylate cyclase/CHASE2 domain-containing sensor protein